ncbi:hypothetical protein ACQPZG_18365 [Streptomyces sp. CA-294286]|uniref:hypothetical protein n=1 Tax=Streptomyces sp. CA-294286 TaxID=3240070 RepID=UPI003D8C974F
MMHPRLPVQSGGILCTVAAHGSADSKPVEVQLGQHRAHSPALACQWLRGRARWIADRLDPEPEHAPVPAAALYEVPYGVPDAPTALRDWCADVMRQSGAVSGLDHGQRIRFMARDDTTVYELSAVPVAAPSPWLRQVQFDH